MIEKKNKKSELVAKMTEHLVSNGLVASGLRALAKAAGTSDRMLLYYFKDKDEILAAVFDQIAQDMELLLAKSVGPDERHDPETLLELLWRDSQSPVRKAYLVVMLEMAAAAARQGSPYREACQRIGFGFQSWIKERLDIEDPQERALVSYRLMASLDGLALLQAVGHEPPPTT